jgi:predicted Zn finger-like uncharacterized protein
MAEVLELSCPRCSTVLEVSEEQMGIARGKVRCGNCLQLFNGISGEIDFVAPQLGADPANPMTGISVRPMSQAEMPDTDEHRPGLLVHATIMLLVLLLAQFLTSGQPNRGRSIEIHDLNVRQHPQYPEALQLSAVLNNLSADSQPYPDLLVHFSNQFGERLNQGLFTPSSYLKGEAVNSNTFPGNTRLQLSLDLADPGHDAVNYGLQLYYVTQSQN